jgi:aspartyl-tRNA(Asn)/glutamyl-tRNA(Gln) amidotransferase subunit A
MPQDLDLKLLTIASTRTAVQERQITATALVEAFYKKIESEDSKPGQVNAYLTLTRERALGQANKLDEIADRGDPLPRLGGVPIAVKDVIVTKGARTTAGSKMLGGYVPPYDSTAISRLEEAGAVVLGKVNCDEFAMGSSTENSAWGPVRNPRDLTRVPGGSSGGSAASVAAGTAVATLGSDTGGSIRQPAAFCGVVGLMPTYGRVSRYGLIAFGSSLDHIGPLTKSARDAAILLRHLAGHDPMDTTSAQTAVPDYELEIGKPVRGLRIGVPREYFPAELDSQVRQSVEAGIQLLADCWLHNQVHFT